uniref:DENN domain-containing protein n=1 Tax=Anopheles atroparvus TaxID=41427 RepID=A0A182JG53_ANOAO
MGITQPRPFDREVPDGTIPWHKYTPNGGGVHDVHVFSVFDTVPKQWREKNGFNIYNLQSVIAIGCCSTAYRKEQHFQIMQNEIDQHLGIPTSAEPHEQIENLVIPIRDGASAAMRDGPENRNFSLILTDHTKRMYCFCRRVLPESSEVCLSLTYCLVTKHNVPKVFYKLLECIEGQHGIGCTPELLIEQLYTRQMPRAGKMLSVIVRQPSQRVIKMVVRRPQDTRLENTELCDVFRCLGPNGMLQVFETLLIEPWQFILITVVPNDMQEMLEVEPVLPMFAGTLNPISEETQKMGHICYVQLDEGTIKQYTTEQQQVPRLPRALRKALLRSLKDMERFKGTNEQAAVRIAEAFTSFFAKLFVDLNTDAYEVRRNRRL